ncbi:MAG: efflux RND transporter permease subunit [Verrucomicrobiales bacterium]
MHISEFSVKRPIFAAVISLILIVLGTVAYQQLPVREYPAIDPPIVSIETRYLGASAEVVDTRITQVLEDQIAGIEGLRTISSTSRDGESNITIEFRLGRDIDAAANDVRDRISRALGNLPSEADPSEVFKVEAGNEVIMWLNLASENLSGLELTDYARRYLVDPLSAVDGVARIRVGGSREYSMRVWLQRDAMAARGITVADIEESLRRENVELPAGRVESVDRYFTVRTERSYRSTEDFGSLVVGRGTDGHLIRLSEVANVTIGAVEMRQELRGNTQDMVGLGVVAQSTANTLEVAKAVKARADILQETLPEGTGIFQSFDRTVFIEESIVEIYRALGVALALVVLVIFFFLGGLRAVLIPAITVPIALLGSLVFLSFMGFSLNLLTLLALLLSIGLVVDDAIVVLENVYRRMHQGESARLGAMRGAVQVSFAVIATTLVLVAVFVPIGFLQGNAGRLFAEFAFALAASVGFSSLVALTLTPMLCSVLLGGKGGTSKLSRSIERIMAGMAVRYRKLLAFTLDQPILVVTSLILIVAATIFFFRRLPNEFAPAEDRGVFFVLMQGPEGASFEYSQRYMREIESELMPIVERGDAIRILARTPGAFGSPTDFNNGRAIVVLAPFGQRPPASELMGEVRQKLGRLAGVRAFPVARSGLVQGVSSPVEFVIGGATYDELRGWRDIILEAAESSGLMTNVQSDFEETKPQLLIRILGERAADLGVSVREIGTTLETFFGSRRVTTFIERGEDYDVILQGADADRSGPEDLENLYVRSLNRDQLIPLTNLVELVEEASAPSLNRFNRLRAVTISADLVEGVTLGEALEYLNNYARENLPPLARIDYKGESREFQEAQGAIFFVLILSLMVVYLVLAAQFESWLHPITILFTVPLAAFGAFLGLYVTGNSLNIFSQIGIILLIGLATKNGILIVEFANQLRDRGYQLKEAILGSCELRLRPILMTSISTVFGALPLALATGAGSENRMTIGIVVVFGVSFATLFTLFVIPFFYDKLGRYTTSPQARSRAIAEEEELVEFKE